MSETNSIVATAVVVGVGLIGGSLAGAWRKAKFAQHIVGIETNAHSAQLALDMGLVDEIAGQVPADAQIVAICTPSDQVAQQVLALAKLDAVLFDVGSVKAPILQTLRAEGEIPARYVPSHPISGSELSGPSAAQADLFKGTTTVLTPVAHTEVAAITLVEAAWHAAGARTLSLSADEHDAMLAVTSHAPHLLAFAYMLQVDEKQLPFSGGGFRDFTRIAASNPELWWRILSMNKRQVLAATDEFQANLTKLTQALSDDDSQTGIALLTAAASLRQSLDT